MDNELLLVLIGSIVGIIYLVYVYWKKCDEVERVRDINKKLQIRVERLDTDLKGEKLRTELLSKHTSYTSTNSVTIKSSGKFPIGTEKAHIERTLAYRLADELLTHRVIRWADVLEPDPFDNTLKHTATIIVSKRG